MEYQFNLMPNHHVSTSMSHNLHIISMTKSLSLNIISNLYYMAFKTHIVRVVYVIEQNEKFTKHQT